MSFALGVASNLSALLLVLAGLQELTKTGGSEKSEGKNPPLLFKVVKEQHWPSHFQQIPPQEG